MTENHEEMSFLDHIEELRWRLIKAASAIILCSIPCGIYWQKILDVVMIYPLRATNPRPKLIYTNPSESVVLSFKIAIAGGLIAASPVVFYQVWKFIAPGLYKNEKNVLLPSVFASTLFFIGGILFSYYSFPVLLKFLTAYGGTRLDPMFKVDEYFGFLLKLSISFGVVFELPVASFVLARMGVITADFLIKKIRYAIVILFILAAVLTPPDVISQMMLGGPLLILYAISILFAAIASRKRKTV